MLVNTYRITFVILLQLIAIMLLLQWIAFYPIMTALLRPAFRKTNCRDQEEDVCLASDGPTAEEVHQEIMNQLEELSEVFDISCPLVSPPIAAINNNVFMQERQNSEELEEILRSKFTDVESGDEEVDEDLWKDWDEQFF